MLWFYRRDQASLSLETRYDNDASQYVAIVVHPDGRRDIERFDRFLRHLGFAYTGGNYSQWVTKKGDK